MELALMKHFYDDGLRFECTQCSKCCRFEPGYVFLSGNDIDGLSKAIGIKRAAFINQYCRTVVTESGQRISLNEKDDYDCILWDKGGCTVYSSRPLQCRTYPFWNSSLLSEKIWNDLEEQCPGINRGRLNSKELVEYWLNREKNTDYSFKR